MTNKPKSDGQNGQNIELPLTDKQIGFINKIAVPNLDGTQDNESLKDLSETYWNLCQWEKGRADVLDTKASYLLGLSSIAGSVVAIGGVTEKTRLWAMAISIVLFSITAILSLFALLGKKYGSFNDEDVFNSLRASEQPVGPINSFTDKDQRRGFIRETILQRWMIYRLYSDKNDLRYRWLISAQIFAVLSILSLSTYILIVLLSK